MNTLALAIQTFPQTQVWNDSCALTDVKQCIKDGGCGATTNPVIVYQVLKKELPYWEPIILSAIQDHPQWSEDDLAWFLIKSMGQRAAACLYPIYQESNGVKGRLSLQTNSKFFNNPTNLVQHAVDLASSIENVQIKAPTSEAGIIAFETLTYMGISINATVCFSVSQAVCVAEAVERGLARRRDEGLSTNNIFPVCTIMAGRLDDYLKEEANQLQIQISESTINQAGIAVIKKTAKIYKERNFTTKLLVAAYRHIDHWYATLGGEIIHTLPAAWQKTIRESDVELNPQMDKSISSAVMQELNLLPGFKQAFELNAMKPSNFQHFGPFVLTMNQFLNGYDQLIGFLRSYMVI